MEFFIPEINTDIIIIIIIIHNQSWEKLLIFTVQCSLKQRNWYSASIIALSLSLAAGRSAGFHLLSLVTGLYDDYCATWVWDQIISTYNWECEPYHSFCHSYGNCNVKIKTCSVWPYLVWSLYWKSWWRTMPRSLKH